MGNNSHDVFICYSRKDYIDEKGIVIPDNWLSKVKDAFDANGISYWFDEEGIYSGDEFASILTKAIRDSKLFLFVSSNNSNQSLWTSNEISTALEYKKNVIPFRIDDSPYNDSVMMKIVSLDYIECQDEKKALNKLIIAVKHHLSGSPLSSKYMWRTIEVPDRARGTRVSFNVDNEWQEHVFVYDDSIGKFKKIRTPEKVSVQKLINEHKKFTEQQCWHLLHDIAKALYYLHSQTPPIAHQEICPGAIILEDNDSYTITDYDISSTSHITYEKGDNNNNNHYLFIGYSAPEMFIINKSMPILASDIWSLGAVMYELMTGEPPLGNYSGMKQMNGAEIPVIEGDYSDNLKKLVYMMLEKEPWNRPAARDIMELAYRRLHGMSINIVQPNAAMDEYVPIRTMMLRRPCGSQSVPCGTEQYAPTPKQSISKNIHLPSYHSSLFSKIKQFFGKKPIDYEAKNPIENGGSDAVLSSLYAPAEIRRKSHMLIQVYLHLPQETEMVKELARESQSNAKRRDYIPLQSKIEIGDKVDVLLSIYGETLLMSEKKSIVWQGSFTKCSFDFLVPNDVEIDELSCLVQLTVNNIPVGEMMFVTKIVESPRNLNPEIISHRYQKIFISYAHQDEARVKFFPEGLKLTGAEYFFDRHYLQAGDIYPQKIQDYINSADLFVLFWSANAAQSEYVGKELAQALERAFPKMKSPQTAKLSIYPMSIEPHAELPSNMRSFFHFGEI